MIFISDIHSSSNFSKLVEKFPKEKFTLCGDIFDRGSFTHDVFQTIKKLHAQGRITITLWNHDLFFIFWLWMHPNSKSKVSILSKTSMTIEESEVLNDIFYSQLTWNGWNETIRSLNENKKDAWHESAHWYADEIADFLFENWNLVNIVDWVVAVHGWIPMLNDWSLVWERYEWIDWDKYEDWINYLKKMDKGIKRLDPKVLYRLSACDNEIARHIYDKMEKEWKIFKKSHSFQMRWDICNFLSTWYNNTYFYGGKHGIQPQMIQYLRWYLDSIWLKRVVAWHYGNNSKNFYEKDKPFIKELYDTIIRFDRSFLWGRVWYVQFDNKWNLIEVSDTWRLFWKKE